MSLQSSLIKSAAISFSSCYLKFFAGKNEPNEGFTHMSLLYKANLPEKNRENEYADKNI